MVAVAHSGSKASVGALGSLVESASEGQWDTKEWRWVRRKAERGGREELWRLGFSGVWVGWEQRLLQAGCYRTENKRSGEIRMTDPRLVRMVFLLPSPKGPLGAFARKCFCRLVANKMARRPA